uniref:Calmegin n=1 Tax=Astyanax mexicanus TaxID=7994 RepID=A0A8B9L2G2_ASTMX
MKPRWGWMCLLLLSVAMVTWAQEEELDEDDEEEAQVEDGDVDSEADSGEMTADANVSFQVTYKTPVPTGEVFFAETFDDGLLSSWTKSKTMKEDADEDIAKYDGGIMFGPDKCGEDYKLHFIFRHKNPLNEDFEEKHAKRADADLRKVYSDKKTHLFTLVLNPDNSYEIFIDQSSASKGNLLTDVIPPVNPPKEIDDPKDTKPEDWDERAKIPDPEAVKPDDWDEEAPAMIPDPDALKPDGWLDEEPEFVPDPTATKPDDWDEEMDGEWEAPQVPNPACQTAPGCGEWKSPTINNPKYKGKWKAPLIDNPNYQGVWSPRKILNPDYFEDLEPFKMTAVRAVGLELWSMTSDIYFDNFIITADKEVADRWAADSWGLKKLVASANEPGVFTQLTLAAEERPWLWVVYILTVGLPIGLGVLFCWPKKIDPSKTGAVEEEEEEEDEVEEEEQKKGNLEDQGNVEEVAEPAEKKNRSGDEDDAAGGEQEEEEDEEEEEEEEQASKSNETPSDDEVRL